MNFLSNKFAAAALAVVYFYTTVFMFPVIHDVFHELGHVAVFFSQCGATQATIVLGSREMCHPNGNKVTFCVHPGVLYNSLNRQAAASPFLANGVNGIISDKCNHSLRIAAGGIFGLLFSWMLVVLVVAPAWYFLVDPSLTNSIKTGVLFLFKPLAILSKLEFPSKRVWFQMVLGLGAIMMQLDLINGIDCYFRR